MFIQIWLHETARITEYIEKIAYQYVIKCNICTLDEICMTNWLAGRSSEPLHKSSLKFLSLWLWHYRKTDIERHRQRKMKYNDFLQRQEKALHHILKYDCKELCNFTVEANKKTQEEHLVILFTNVTVCLNAIQYDIYSPHEIPLMCAILHLSV